VGWERARLRLRVADGGGQPAVKTFATGWGTGTRSSLSFPVPPEVYGRFRVRAGLHAELGASGQVRFEVLGNGRRLAAVGPLAGKTPSKLIDVAVAGVTNLQLVATSAGGDGSGNYAVWAEPQLVKDKLP